MYHNFTELIKQWLETPSNQQDYSVSALYLLKLSGNQIIYRNIIAQLDRRHDLHNSKLEIQPISLRNNSYTYSGL